MPNVLPDKELHRFFATEVERLADRLYGSALRLTRNAQDAEDLVAETVAKAWARLEDLQERQRFEGWIRRILNNTFISEWRHRRVRPEVLIDATTRAPPTRHSRSSNRYTSLSCCGGATRKSG